MKIKKKLGKRKQAGPPAKPKKQMRKKKGRENSTAKRPRQGRPSKKGNSRNGMSNRRRYSSVAIKELFALSSNQCAFPDCTNEIVLAGTPLSDAAVVGHICHIYAASDDGPRGNPRLSTAERNSPANLILMCGAHHPQVDKQWETYPASELLKWKATHEAKATRGTAEAIKREGDIEKHVFFEAITDEQIEKALSRLRRARYLVGFRTAEEAQLLATQVERSQFSSGSADTRARALAWCARISSQDKPPSTAVSLLSKSRQLARTSDAEIAEAFITAATDRSKALADLAKLQSPGAYAAALRIVTNLDGAKKALAWFHQTGIRPDELDGEGKLTLITNALIDEEWELAREFSCSSSESDYSQCPSLMYAVAMAKLLGTIPRELRLIVFTQVPLELDTFYFSSAPEDLEARRAARLLFSRVSAFAAEMGVASAADIAADYALWLGLRDAATHDAALAELRDSMNDPHQALRRMNFAIRFGLKVDIAAIEERIDKSIALSGNGTPDEALARLALVFAQKDPKSAAEYFAKHRAQLFAHLQKQTLVGFEIELDARSGSIATAREKLTRAIGEGMSTRDRAILEGILAEVSGADPIAERRALYESSGEVRALANLVEALEKAQLWQELLPYAQKQFAEIPSAETYETVVRCLERLGRYDVLLTSMEENQAFVDQSRNLQMHWAWTLYREGRFVEAKSMLEKIPNRGNANHRNLRINIAVASGAWDEVFEYCHEIWSDRDCYSATDLMHAARLSQVVGGPHSRDLVIAAVQRELDNPTILASAYFHATNAGWEDMPTVSEWLSRAATLSSDDGPLQSISIEEIIERKPKWDELVDSVWSQLRKGEIPTFAAAQLLKRSLLDLTLVPSLSNPSEEDIRKRGIIFAFSGGRNPTLVPELRTIAIDVSTLTTLIRLGLFEKLLSLTEILLPHSTLGWLFQEAQRVKFHQPSRIRRAESIKRLIARNKLKVARLDPPTDVSLTREVGADLSALLTHARDKSASGTRAVVIRSSPIHRVSDVLGEPADVSGYESVICSCTAVVDFLKAKGALIHSEEQRARDFLKLHERQWPTEPALDDTAEIYLDDLSTSYLQTAGVLEKLATTGAIVFITPSQDSEANDLIDLRTLEDRQLEFIESIRATVSSGIASGRVRAVRTLKDAEDDDLFRLHPTFGALGLASKADAVVVDDRFVNRHATMTSQAGTSSLLCSLDLLAMLHARGAISTDELFAHRTVLRQCGYQLIPVTDDELEHYLMNASVVAGELVETGELRAIRESLLRLRMSEVLQLPTEAPFLHSTLGAFIRAIKRMWQSIESPEAVMGRANYLLGQLDVRKWTFATPPGNERNFALYAFAAYAVNLGSPPDGDTALQARYCEWITKKLFGPIKEYQPEIYSWIVERSREVAVAHAEEAAREHELESQRS